MAEATFTQSGGTTAASGAQGAAGGTGDPAAAAAKAAAGGEQKTAEQLAAEQGASNQSAEDQAKAKIEADKKAADEQAAKEAAKAQLFDAITDLKLPDGVTVDEEMGKEFAAVSKEAGLSKVLAQKFADLSIKSVAAFTKQLQAEAQAQVKAWGDEIANDKELGGAKVSETVASAEKLLTLAETIPGVNVTRFKTDLIRTGMANHPDMIRVARFIGQFVGDDKTFIPDRSSAAAQQDMATSWYGPDGGIKQRD